MQGSGTRRGGSARAGILLLGLIAASGAAAPAHADLYSASKAYGKGDYAGAFKEFRALARLGLPAAQYDLAVMYLEGQGVRQSDIHAYAWATLAAASGDAIGLKLADEIRPRLAPGSRRIAGWFTAAYVHSALERRLLPAPGGGRSRRSHGGCSQTQPVNVSLPVYPIEARYDGVQGDVLGEFTLMPDGTTRFPRIVYSVPSEVFDAQVRHSLLHSRFAPRPGAAPVQCYIPYHFVLKPPPDNGERLREYLVRLKRRASAGDPFSQLLYALVLAGQPQLHEPPRAWLPWFVKAAQAGLPAAQYQLAVDLMNGTGCHRDVAKALRWLRMAARAHDAQAEVALAIRSLRGTPTDENLAQARDWLEPAVAQGDRNATLLLAALLAAAPDPQVRDPARALALMRKIYSRVSYDPTAFEIRAAAQAAQGHFAEALRSERAAIKGARSLHWSLGPLSQRLASYQAGKPWYGSLLEF
jgi:TonB family protein